MFDFVYILLYHYKLNKNKYNLFLYFFIFIDQQKNLKKLNLNSTDFEPIYPVQHTQSFDQSMLIKNKILTLARE